MAMLKFIYSEKAIKFCEIFTLLLSYVMPVKSKVKISQNIVAFSEYMNFNWRTFFFRIFAYFLKNFLCQKPKNHHLNLLGWSLLQEESENR